MISRQQVRESFFSDSAHASPLAAIDGLISSQDSPAIDPEVSAAILDAVATIPDEITQLPPMHIEVAETPFLSTLYATRESEPDTDAKQAALHTAELLAAAGCRIDE